MKWSFKLARIADIDVHIHYTFFLLVAWFAYMGFAETQTIWGAADGVVFISALFTCVVLHEFGHALMGRRFGVKTDHIILLPIGGVAAMEDIPKDGKQEVLIALAGPMVNVVIAGLIWFYFEAGPSVIDEQAVMEGDIPFLAKLFYVNLFLAVFNLIPAFPMDGGRVLRGLLSFKLQHAKATLWASRIGKFFAALFVAYGLATGQTMLVIIGAFIFMGATGENRVVQFRAKVKELPVLNVAVSPFNFLMPMQTLYDAKYYIDQWRQQQQIFPIGDLKHLSYLISIEEFYSALHKLEPDQWSHYKVSDLPELLGCRLEVVKSIDGMLTINQAIEEVGREPSKLIAVEHQGSVKGIITIQRLLQLAEM